MSASAAAAVLVVDREASSHQMDLCEHVPALLTKGSPASCWLVAMSGTKVRSEKYLLSDCRALQLSDRPWFDSGWPDQS